MRYEKTFVAARWGTQGRAAPTLHENKSRVHHKGTGRAKMGRKKDNHSNRLGRDRRPPWGLNPMKQLANVGDEVQHYASTPKRRQDICSLN